MYKNHGDKFSNLVNKTKNLVSAKSVKMTGVGENAKNRANGFKNHASEFRNLVPCLPLVGVMGVMGLSFGLLRIPYSTADSSIQASLTVPSSCSFVGTLEEDEEGNQKEHSATIINGQYQDEIGSTVLRTYCNDANGYQIQAIGYSNDKDGNTDLIEQLPEGSADTPNTIATGVYTGAASGSAPSSWSMKLTPVKGTYAPTIESDLSGSFSDYHVIPSVPTLVASYPAGTSGKYKTDSSLTTTYAAYASLTQPAGTYVGQVKYTMVKTDAALEACNPTGTTINTIHCMQDFNSTNKVSIINSMEENVQYQLRDVRDGNYYYIAKLQTSAAAPGGVVTEGDKSYQVWMTQNLDLCIGCAGTTTLTSENTDINQGSTQAMYSVYDASTGYSVNNGITTWTPAETAVTSGRTVPETGTGDVSGVTGWANDYNIPYSAEGGDTYVITSGSTGDDTVSTTCDRGETVCPHYKRGNYYNWPAAVASNDTSSITENYAAADNSICPLGWKLPTGMTAEDGYSDLNYMFQARGAAENLVGTDQTAIWAVGGFVKIREDPLYFVRAGDIRGNMLAYSGANCRYWASTTYSSRGAHGFLSTRANIYPSRSAYNYRGVSVRCIVR